MCGRLIVVFSSIAHFVFFFGAASNKTERLQNRIFVTEEVVEVVSEKQVASAVTFAPVVVVSQPPVYNSIWRTENPFEDAKSTRSLPLYNEEQIGPFEHYCYEKKEKEMVEVTVFELPGSPV